MMTREPTAEEKRLMAQYGIAAESKTVYRYKGHTYEHLEHAIKYAKIDAARSSVDSGELHSKKTSFLRAFLRRKSLAE